MSLVLAPKMYGRKGGLVDFAGGNQSAGSLKEFFETNFMPCNEVATPTAGGTLTLNGVNCGSYDYVLKRSNQDLTSKLTFSDWFTTTEDTRSAIIGIVGDFTLRSGTSSESGATGPCIFRPRQRKLFMAIYVQGNLNIEGAYERPYISMTARGANHSGSGNSGGATTKCAIRLATGTYSGIVNPEVPASGGAGASGVYQSAGAGGGNGTGGGLGGGGGGGAASNSSHTSGGSSAGTSFASGSGGGATQTSDQGGQAVSSGGANGGAGGNCQVPSSYWHFAGSGAGNPAGLYQGSTAVWASGQSGQAHRNNDKMEQIYSRFPHGGSINVGSTWSSAYQTASTHHYGNVHHPGMETRFDGYDSGCAGTLIVFCSGTMTGSGRLASNGLDGGSDGGGGTGGGHVSVFYGTNSSSYTLNVAGQLGGGFHAITGGLGGTGTGRMMQM